MMRPKLGSFTDNNKDDDRHKAKPTSKKQQQMTQTDETSKRDIILDLVCILLTFSFLVAM